MKAWLTYTWLRLLLFVACATALWAVGLRSGLLIILIALLVSGLVSLVLLRKQREAAAESFGAARRNVTGRIEAATAKEDEVDDELRHPDSE